MKDKISEAFESSTDKAPDSAWNKIESELDADKIDHAVKSGFDSNLEKAPASIWDTVQDAIDQNEDNSVDLRVAKSYQVITDTAPETVWDRVQTELDIDRVWFRISHLLSRSNRRVNPVFAGIAAALLVLIAFPVNLYRTDEISPIESSSSPVMVVCPNEEMGISSAKKGSAFGPLAVIKTPKNSPYKFYRAPNTGFLQKTTDSVVSTSSMSIPPAPIQDILNSVPLSATIQMMPGLFPEVLNGSYNLHEINDSNLVCPPTNQLYSKFSVGLFAGLHNSWVIDNETRAGFRPSSLVENELSFGSSYGLVGAYNLSEFHLLNLEVFFNQNNKQDQYIYNNGNYLNKRSELDYYKLALTMGFKSKGLRTLRTVVYGGVYASKLKYSAVSYNGILISYNDAFDQLDVGIRLIAAKEYSMRRFTASLGLSGEFGLLNIAGANASKPKNLNFTRNLDVGVLSSIRYNF